MLVTDIWRNITQRIGFYTKETNSSIPDSPGIYAWFIPLWIIDDDLEILIKKIANFYFYDPIIKNVAKKETNIDFNWETFNLKVHKRHSKQLIPSENLLNQWNKIIGDKEKKNVISKILMEASIFMPPLYVGKADNLKSRYLQHIKTGEKTLKENTFNTRFTEFAITNDFPFKVNDLLFVCIEIDKISNEILNNYNLNTLVEQVVMRLCRPKFSVK